MNKQTHRIYKDLLSLQGHFADPALVDAPEAPQVRRRNDATSWFSDFLLLGGHEPIDPHMAGDAVVASEARVCHC